MAAPGQLLSDVQSLQVSWRERHILMDFKLPIPAAVIWSGTFRGRVFALSRPRRSGLRIYQPLDDQRELRAWMYSLRPEIPFRADMWVECLFIFKTSRSLADCDNLLKAVYDGLQSSGIISNDRHIVGGSFMRVISDHDECQIVIREALHYDPTSIPACSRKRRSIRIKKRAPKSGGRSPNGKRKEPG